MDHRHELVPGTVLDRKYRIERVLGLGGFGITYAALDFGLATEVAIKEYYPTQFATRDSTLSIRPASDFERPLFDRMRASFLREARTLARFDHPSIVRVLNVFEAHGTAYMVMKLETGPSLKSWRTRLQRRPSQDEIDLVASHLLDALEVMHAATFLHRDVAPDNVIIRGDGSPVILDFGATRRVMGEATGTMTGIVKRGYSPQEQYSSDSRGQGPWTDIYSLAGTLYYAITGAQPTDATERMLDDRMLPLSSRERGNYRLDFLEAIDWGMQLRPNARPQSIADWRERMFRKRGPSTASPLRESTRPKLLPSGPEAAKQERPKPVTPGRPGITLIGGAAALSITAVVAGALMLRAAGLFDAAIAPSANVARREADPSLDQAKKLTERLALEAAARRDRDAAEQKAREDAARIAAEAAAKQQREAAEQKAREDAARIAAEAAAKQQREAAERKAREDAARVAAEVAARQQREAAEQKAREEAARIAAEAAARQQREAAEQKAREDAARVAAEAAARQQREAAEQKAREDAARVAAEAAAKQQREAAERNTSASLSPAPAVPESQRKLIAGIRSHLNRVGCHSTATAAGWTPDDQKALERFVKYAGTAFTFTQLNDEIAEAVGSYAGRVCPSQCGPDETAGIDRCVPAAAPAIAVRCSQINERAQLGLLTEEDRDTLRTGRCRN